MKEIFITILIGYLMGCLQWSYLLTKIIKKEDIRNLGGGNAGASNTVKVFGWKMGVTVALLDIFKAIISILIIKYLFDYNMTYLYLNGTAVILGHNYPFFMNFRGGKGTASTLGMLFGINFTLGIIGFFTILIVTFITDYIAIGTISLVSLFILATLYLEFGNVCLLLAIFIALQSLYKHIPNIKRIIVKEEPGLRGTFRKSQKI